MTSGHSEILNVKLLTVKDSLNIQTQYLDHLCLCYWKIISGHNSEIVSEHCALMGHWYNQRS